MSGGDRSYHIGTVQVTAPALPAGLYLVATPIGNLRDVTLRALEVLAAAHLVLCEDTRVTAKLMERYGIRAKLRPCHDHNERQLAEKVVADIGAGMTIALVSDAGTPLLSDPGYKLVEACLACGALVTALPGASALLPALQLSGLPGSRFTFLGFAPEKKSERSACLVEWQADPNTLVFYESPHRLTDFVSDIVTVLGNRPMAIARELTKLHEEMLRGPALDVLAALEARESIKGECVVVIAGAPKDSGHPDAESIARMIRDAAAAMPASKAAAQVAKLTGLSREEAFRRILAHKAET